MAEVGSLCDVDKNAVFVSVGLSYLGGFVEEAARAIRSRALSIVSARPVTESRVREFFEKRSEQAEQVKDDIIAIGSRPYAKLIAIRELATAFARLGQGDVLLDYGCGDGTLLEYIRARYLDCTYVGCDADRVAIEKAQSVLADRDARFLLSSEELPAFDLAVLSNVLVYNQTSDARAILCRLRHRVRPSGELLVVEPYPAWYWETVFDGMRLCPRTSRQIGTLLIGSGWVVDRKATVALFSVNGYPFLPIAFAVVARPEASVEDMSQRGSPS